MRRIWEFPNYSSSTKYYTIFWNFIFYFRATPLYIYQQFSKKKHPTAVPVATFKIFSANVK